MVRQWSSNKYINKVNVITQNKWAKIYKFRIHINSFKST